jgi:pullulanase/glycogen debranching enzyme
MTEWASEQAEEEERRLHPRTPLEDTIIYELHVRGYTIDPSSGVRHPGTYQGLIEKIDDLKALGITAVELLPVDEFDENDCSFVNPLTGEALRNFWGYNTIAFCAPKRSTRPGSRSTSTSSSITPRRGARTGRLTASGAWTTRSSTCWTKRAAT